MAPVKIKTVFTSQPLWQQFVIVLIFNSLVAVLIKAIIPNSSFYNQMLISQSIGWSIFLSLIVMASFFELKTWRIILPLIIGTPIGLTIVIIIQAIMLNLSFDYSIGSLKENYTDILSLLFAGLFFGAIILVFFSNRERIFREKTKLQTEQINNLDHKKTIAETNLRLLQAQIEPHFLFNTLSNVISLIEKDPQTSKKLLESLTDFLRATLKRSTDSHQSLQDEINLIQDYMDIFKLRIGKRLEYNINLDDEVMGCVFPPLLLQPLVENAIIHGIEPLVEGGFIDISIKAFNQKIVITVADSGKGFSGKKINGFGLTNIRERIKSLYGDAGSLTIEENNSTGVTATIKVPYESI